MTTFRPKLSRRNLLRGAGTLGVALPFLEGMPSRSAWAAGEKPVFSLFICTANGVAQKYASEPETFWPTATGALTTASLQADAASRSTGILAEHASKLLIVKGVKYPSAPGGCGHAQGLAMCLTAAPISGTANKATSTGPSADSVIATGLGVEPLTLYSGMKGGYIDEKLSFSAAGKVRAAEGNPYNVYQRLMGLFESGTGEPNGMADRLALKRKSVNDLVREELKWLQARPELSKADLDRLDQHFTAIRDVENGMTGMGVSCSAEGLDVAAIQAMNTGNAFRANGKLEEVAKLQMQLIGLAFACNSTRVATLQVGDGTDGTRYTVDGKQLENFHHISHRVRSDGASGEAIPDAAKQHAAIDRIRINTFKHLLDTWSAYQTDSGSLLDNAFAMWTSHVAIGPSHAHNDLPIIIAGNAGGYLKTGQYINAGGAGNNKLLNTLITAAGVPTQNFGQGAAGLIDAMVM
ncbi:MAG: hypothetical protein K0R38_5606 [Polyangiaceae bacterium]|nr:hypothetical protein [Polyangiaceae bacterium]